MVRESKSDFIGTGSRTYPVPIGQTLGAGGGASLEKGQILGLEGGPAPPCPPMWETLDLWRQIALSRQTALLRL